VQRPLRVLLIEDSEPDVESLARELRRGGYDPQILCVQTAAAMQGALRRQVWDLVVSDHNLPQFSGLEALQILQATGRDIPFVIVSGQITEERAIQLMRAGARDFVMKGQIARLLPVVERELREAQHRLERRRARQAQLASEERYRELFENASDVVFTLDLAGRFTSLNRAGERITGYTRQEARTLRLADTVAPESAATVRARLAPENRDEPGAPFEAVLIGKDGRRIPLEIGWRHILRDRVLVGFEAIARDTSERQRLEEELRQAQKMEAVGRLAGGIAHDFNNLLMAVAGFSELLLDKMAADDPLRRSVEEIRNAGTRATALTRQLLTFSRKQVVTPVVIDVNVIVADLERMLRRVIGEDIELTTALAAGGASVLADRGQLEQVIVNLVVNARDAMPSGGRLRIATSHAEVLASDAARLPGVAPGEYVLIEVSDTGCGMDAATLSHVFEPFFTTKEPGRGTGLGLSTVYGIVRQAGGAVLVDSSPGKGSVFRIFLPLSAAATPRRAYGPGRPSLPTGTETILLVEDETGVRELIRDALVRCGYRVLEAPDPATALTLFQGSQGRIDVLITDVVMPQMNGRMLAERLLEARPSLRVLYMSGYTDDEGVGQSVTSGAEFLQKPFTPDVLARTVRDLLDRGSPAAR
jgi:PAS domain S-box-containing protein